MAEVRQRIYTTGFASPDNDPANSANIAYPNARHPMTGSGVTAACYGAFFEGLGTYEYPIPLAADIRDIPANTVLYIEHIQVYGEVVDYCQASVDRHNLGNTAILLVDVWVGGSSVVTDATALTAAANSITRLEEDEPAYAIFDPLPGKPVRSVIPISGIGSSCSRSFGPARTGPVVAGHKTLVPQYVGLNFGHGAFADQDTFVYENPAFPFYHDAALNTDAMALVEGGEAFVGLPNYNVIRIGEKWERIQPTLNTALNSARLVRLTTEINATTSRGAVAIINIHNYALYSADHITSYAIGTTQVPASAFYDLWSRLASAFKDNPLVWLGLMNEPYTYAAGSGAIEWAGYAQGALNAIRATGATNKVLVPGIGYTGAHSWINLGNDVAYDSFTDPLNNFAIELHQYADSDFSGTHRGSLVSEFSYAGTLAGVTTWARSKGYTCFLGEFNTDREIAPIGERAMAVAMRYLQANADVWIGCAAWFGGPLPVNNLNTLTTNADGSFPERHDLTMRAIMVPRIVVPENVTPPTIMGTPKAGDTLTTNTGTWVDATDEEGLGLEYETKWMVCPTGTCGSYTNIVGETQVNFAPSPSHTGSFIQTATRAKNIAMVGPWVNSVPVGPVAAGVAVNKFLVGMSNLANAVWVNIPSGNLISVTADTINGDSTSGFTAGRQRSTNVTSGQVYTTNFRAEAGTVDRFVVGMDGAAGWRFYTIDLGDNSATPGLGGGGVGSTFGNLTTAVDSAGGRRIDFEWTPSVSESINFWVGIAAGFSGTMKFTDFWFGEATERPADTGELLINADNLSLSPWYWNRTGTTNQAVTANTINGSSMDGAGAVIRNQDVTIPSGKTGLTWEATFSDPTGTGDNPIGNYGTIGLQVGSGFISYYCGVLAGDSGVDNGSMTGYTLNVGSLISGKRRFYITGPAPAGPVTVWIGLPNNNTGPVQIDAVDLSLT